MASRPVLFPRPSGREWGSVRQYLSTEFLGGIALFFAVILALVFANTPLRSAYVSITHFQLGYGAFRFDVKTWAADGLLAIFFTVAGLELRREMTHGDLKNPRRAALPILAALCGMAFPAIIYTLINSGNHSAVHAWAIPTSTDLAFSLTILGVAGSRIPNALRAFLLTLAITDDVATIILIAIFYSQRIDWPLLAGSFAVLALYGFLQKKGFTAWWIAIPLGISAWAFMQHSGVHATVAGVLVGLLTNPHRDRGDSSPVERFERVLSPFSALISVPFFAFVTIGIAISAAEIGTMWHDKITYGIIIGRIFGKVIGIVGGAWLIAKLTKAELNPALSWWDVASIGMLGGIGFSVSLLVALIALGNYPNELLAAQSGILFSGIIASILAVIVLQIRGRAHHRRSSPS
ncbi:MAG TPA: Na+/H+ antiporter NhaA [Candidatus Nanopelagicaceae bacterium]|nr:Na+/H+ antiporter NhaA [Candidatus Nanopelagicaceae bacterium]